MEIDWDDASDSPGDSFSNTHLQPAVLTREHQTELSTMVMIISAVLAVSPLVAHYVTRKSFVIGPQFVAMCLGIVATILAYYLTPSTGKSVFALFPSPHRILDIYYPLLILRFVYAMDTYMFVKSFWQILIISVFGWLLLVVSFGFLLLTFAGGLSTLSLPKLILVGAVFSPMEMPTELFHIDQMKLIEVMLTSESIFTTILAMTTMTINLNDISGMYNYWYEPVLETLRRGGLACALGIPIGMLNGAMYPKLCSNGTYMMITISSGTYLLYIFCTYVMQCSAGLCCFIFMFAINRKRLEVPIHIDKDVVRLIDMLFCCVSIAFSFVVVLQTLPYFLANFHIMNAAVSVALYICANVLRFVFFIGIAPVLSRLGYGFNFKTMMTLVWCVRKGPIPFIMLGIVCLQRSDDADHQILILGLNFLFLTNMCNEASAWTIIRKLGVTGDDFLLKKANMKNAIKVMRQRRNHQLAVMRMNRFYSDANWAIINETTQMCPSVADDEGTAMESGMNYEERLPYCSDCRKDVAYEPTMIEYEEKLNEAKLRVLHAMRVSFGRQYETGFIDITELRSLNHALEVILDSQHNQFKIDEFVAMLKEKRNNRFFGVLRSFLFSHASAAIKGRYVPRHQRAYLMMTHWAFRTFFDLITLGQVAISIMMTYAKPRISLEALNIIVIQLFLVEFFIKVQGCVQDNFRDGFKRYIRSIFNKCDLIIIIVGILDATLNISFYYTHASTSKHVYMMYVIVTMRTLRFLRIIRVVRFCRLLAMLQVALIVYYDKRTDAQVSHLYGIGKAIVISLEEVEEMIHCITNEPRIIDFLRAEVENDKNRIARELGMIEKDRPWVTVGMKSRQAMMCTVKTMVHAVNQLGEAGLIDRHEYNKLNEVIGERWKVIRALKTDMFTSPRRMLFELPWIGHDENIFEFLYENVSLRVWDAGDVIVDFGDVAEGIIVMVAGLFKMTYVPSEEGLKKLKNSGMLPVKDFIAHARFKNPIVEYLYKGNSIGELSLMTGRAYDSQIVAETPCQAFVISRQILVEALKMSKDPVQGLYSRIWLHISTNLIRRLLLDTPLYSTMTYSQLNAVIERSIAPKLDAYKTFVWNELIEDIFLIEGVAVDYSTREIYVGPCYIPRGATKFMLPDYDNIAYSLGAKPKLWIIPVKGVDEYEVMVYSEMLSDLSHDASDSCFLARNFAFRKWRRIKSRQDASMYTLSSFSSNTLVPSSIQKLLLGSTERIGNITTSRPITFADDDFSAVDFLHSHEDDSETTLGDSESSDNMMDRLMTIMQRRTIEHAIAMGERRRQRSRSNLSYLEN